MKATNASRISLRPAPPAAAAPTPVAEHRGPEHRAGTLVLGALAVLFQIGAAAAPARAAEDSARPFSATWSIGAHDAAVLAADIERLTCDAPSRDAEGAADATHLVWVGLTDKGIRSDSGFRTALDRAENALTDASRARRLRAGGPWIVDYLDLPVPDEHVEQIAGTGADVRVVSRWLAAVSVEATDEQLRLIAELPCVARLTPVARGARSLPPDPSDGGDAQAMPPAGSALLPLDYGMSLDQLEQIQVTDLHGLGYTGAGVIVCMLDTGFFKDHEAFGPIQTSGRLLAEWDFINGDGNTQNEGGDSSSQHNHGTVTWSTLGGESAGNLYGPAYGASFVIGKTEDVTDEYPLEEDFYVAGLEWADGLGAQVVSSSLGYIDWYTYEDMDGETAVTTNACDIAASRNILVCTAAGNEGNSPWYYMIAPSDGDSVIACGAVNVFGEIAGFSSHGPTFDGRTKPEVCARGVDTWCAIPGTGGNDYTDASGTSLSTPLVGGVAALLMEARPTWTAMQVREAMMMTADNASQPDNDYGWGIVRALDAYNYGSVAVDLDPAPAARGLVRATPNPLGRSGSIDLSIPGAAAQPVNLRLYDVTGRLRAVVLDRALAAGSHRLVWEPRDARGSRLVPGVYFLRAAVGDEVAISRIVVSE